MGDVLIPDWPAPANVRALQTLRTGGCSPAPWNSFNLGDHVGDDPANVAANRAALRAHLPAEPLWLTQVHGNATVDADFRPFSESSMARQALAGRPRRSRGLGVASLLRSAICSASASVLPTKRMRSAATPSWASCRLACASVV